MVTFFDRRTSAPAGPNSIASIRPGIAPDAAFRLAFTHPLS